MEDCIFCKIVAGEIPSDKIYEDEGVLAFMDIRPVSRGHALVIPKNHSKDVLEVEEKDLHQVLAVARKLSHAVMKAVGAEGFTISTNRGEAAGQTVFHLHFHIIPRFRNDGLKPWQHQETEPKTRKEIAGKIKQELV
jgi:histidine triad (HIT) family protein